MLAKIKEDKAFGCLIIPMWKSANFWPILCLNGNKFCDCLKIVVYLPSDKQFFMSGRSVGSMFGNTDLNFPILGLYNDCR